MMNLKTDYVKKNVRVALYVRVSTQEQAKEGYSIGEQIERLQKFAEAHEWCVVKIYTDAGHSGANMERPALQEMIADIMAGKIDKVAVYKLDRLSRSQKDTLKLIEDIFLSNNCDFESMTEKFDTATSFGRAMVGILAVFAQLEREQIKERMTMGMEARIKTGKWRGGPQVPFGYDYETGSGKLTVNEYESMMVKYMFNEYAAGVPLRRIVVNLQEKGFKLRNGKIDGRNIRYILTNKTYCGYLRNKDKWEKGLHEPIIDEGLFEKCNVVLTANRIKFEESGIYTGTKAQTTALGGLIWCKHCGARYGKSKTGTKQYGYHDIYSCYSRHKKVKSMIIDPNCKNKIYRKEVLDNIIFNEIKKLAIDPEYIQQVKKKPEPDKEEAIHAIEAHVKQIDAQISRFMDLYGIGKFTIEQLESKTDPLQEEKEKLEKELLNLRTADVALSEEKAAQIIETFDEVMNSGDLESIRSILEQLIDKIEIDGEDIFIHWNF